MKTELLKLLRESGEAISGQELCRIFGVSRTAIWKNINQLKEEGYEITAVRNRGYLLTGVPDKISKHELESRLSDCEFGRRVLYFDSTQSTNQVLRADPELEHGVLAVADEQTMGRGRRGRSWQSPPGTGISMSFLIRDLHDPERCTMITILAALAVRKALNRVTGMECMIKWPNDILIHERKVCGILTEMSTEESYVNWVIVGIGINVSQTGFDEELREKATSLLLEGGKKYNRADIIEWVMRYFEEYYGKFRQGKDLSAFTEEYNNALINAGRKVEAQSEREIITGVGAGIDSRGRFIVDQGGTCKLIASGEVSVRGVYGYV